MVTIETNGTESVDETDAVAALERFVVENDELLELEERIGRFNIFDALRIDRMEIRHSNFLAWLLDPNESHGQGGLFLRALLMDLFKTARENGFDCPASPIELDGEDLRGVEIRREWKHIDLLISCDRPRFVVAIENKIDSGEHSDQLSRYIQTVKSEFGETPTMYVFLTVEGDEPSEEDWVPYSYGEVHRVLTRVRNANAKSVGEDVIAFLDHYLRLIRGRLMDDPKIDELCERIYKNHRQAINMIVERVASESAQISAAIADLISQSERWILVHRTKKSVFTKPTSWNGLLPPIRAGYKTADYWIAFEIRVEGESCSAYIYACPTNDTNTRTKVIERMTRDPQEFGCQIKGKITPEWTTLSRRKLASWDKGELDVEKICAKAESILEQWDEMAQKSREALATLFNA